MSLSRVQAPPTGTDSGWGAALTGESSEANRIHYAVWSMSFGARMVITTVTNAVSNFILGGLFRDSGLLTVAGNAGAGFQGISVIASSIEVVTTATAFGRKMAAFWAVRDVGPSASDIKAAFARNDHQCETLDGSQSTSTLDAKKSIPIGDFIEAGHHQLKYAAAREDLIQATTPLARDSVLQSGSGVCNALGFISHFAPAVGFASAAQIPIVGNALGIASGGLHVVQGYRTCKVSAISHAASQTVILHANDGLKDLSTYKGDSVESLADKMDAARRARKPLPDVSGVPHVQDPQQHADPACEQAAAKLAARAAKYDEAVTEGKTEAGGLCMQRMLTVTAALLDLSVANETCNQTKMNEDIRVSKSRIIYGVIAGTLCVLMLLGIVVLGLSGVGAVLLGLVALSQGAGAIWLAYASRRAERAVKAAKDKASNEAKDKAANEALASESAVKAQQATTENARTSDVDVAAPTPQKNVALEAVEILTDDRPQNALARNHFKAALVGLGLSNINFFLLKHVSRMGPGVTLNAVKGLVTARIERLVADDGARLRVGKRGNASAKQNAKDVSVTVREETAEKEAPPPAALAPDASISLRVA